MSEAIAFDTHRFVKNLTASGFTEQQAEALAHEQVHLLDANLATKSDLAAVRAGLEFSIETVKAEVHSVKADILKWMITAMMAQTALVVTLIRYWGSTVTG